MTEALCPRHLPELVPEHHHTGVLWQTRWAIIAIELTTLALADRRIQARIGAEFDPTVASLVLAEACPLCCFIEAGAFGTLKEKLVERIAAVVRGTIQRGGAG
jgi:hypothetical protein